jgi:hypothetical protein
MHSSLVEGGDLKWVAACGFKGLKSVRFDAEDGKSYKLRLVFLEPDAVAAGERVFDVVIQGKTVLKNFDVTAAAGKAQVGVVREFVAQAEDDEIFIELRAAGKLPPVISGVEVVEQ